MEWYYASDIEDLAVPKDEEIFDWLPSPDSWSPWGKIVGNFNSPKKLSRSDVQLDDLAIDEADDIFFRSLFEADSREIHGADSSANFTQTSSEYDDLLGERNPVEDCPYNVENVSPFAPAKEPEFEISFSEEYSNMYDDISEEDISQEESVLLELQRSTLQLAEKTRICFRDSLYRLAENSRHQTSCSQNRKEAMEKCKPTASGGPSRSRESKAKESVAKSIDRTVATLLFNTMKYYNPSAASTSDLTEETFQREHQANSSRLYQPSPRVSSLYSVPGGDAEVPTFGLMNQPLPRPKCLTHFSTVWS